ncbi:MAG: aminotransferase class IV, partial [Allosphingosinicella sp.]
RFVATERSFDLIETMAFDPHDGIANLDGHLARMKASARALDFPFDRHEARNELQAATFRAGASKIRLLLSRSGAMAIELRPPESEPCLPVEVAIVPLALSPSDFRLAHKTTDRAFYDEPRRAAGTWEVLFRDQTGFLTEGSFSNLFVERGGKLLTPPLSRGLLPGLCRQGLIDQGKAVEADLTEADLANGFFLGNSLRGLLPARLKAKS